MKAFQKAGLYGDGLILIDKPELVARYNDCLRDMGLRTTRKRKFHIDCMGWSPEIAEGFDNYLYLSHGEANPLAIILVPEQRHAPIYFPFHSFDWALMRKWFEMFKDQIEELTKFTAICLDIDQEVPSYQDEQDLVTVDDVTIHAKTPNGLIKDTKKQRELVEKIMKGDDIFRISEATISLSSSISDIGSMHEKNVEIPDMVFDDLCVYYTRAFGGIFVLCDRNSHDGDDYFILHKSTAYCEKGINSVIDKNIIDHLIEFALIDHDMTYWRDNVHLVKILRDSFLMDHLDRVQPNVNYVALNSARKKGVLAEVSTDLPEEYHLLNQVVHQLNRGRVDISLDSLIETYFYHPASTLDDVAAEVLWHILTLVCDGRHIVRLYRHDKDQFFADAEGWHEPKRTWAIAMIKKYHEHRLL